jgi:hypothetical protein
MRINEITLNEGVLDQAKALGSKVSNSALGGYVGRKVGDLDWWKKQAYTKLGGLGGDSFKSAATRSGFVNNVVNDYNAISKSYQLGGQGELPMDEFVDNYIKKFNWSVSPTEVDRIIASSNNDINKIANNLFVIASRQSYDKQGRVAGDRPTTATGNQQQAGGMSNTASGDDVQLNPASSKIIQNIDHMLGGSNADDLEKIAVAAMNKLNAISPAKYAALRKQIINPPAQNTQQQAEPGGRIEPTFESKARKISNRNK